jgi:hypothetical protein
MDGLGEDKKPTGQKSLRNFVGRGLKIGGAEKF